jgi:hypothetical protein
VSYSLVALLEYPTSVFLASPVFQYEDSALDIFVTENWVTYRDAYQYPLYNLSSSSSIYLSIYLSIYIYIYKSESMFVAMFVGIFVCMYTINSLTL